MASDLGERLKIQMEQMSTRLLVQMLLTQHFQSKPDPGAEADRWLALAELMCDQMSFDNVPPELSDVASQEFRDAMIRTLTRAKAVATQEPHDPAAFQRSYRPLGG